MPRDFEPYAPVARAARAARGAATGCMLVATLALAACSGSDSGECNGNSGVCGAPIADVGALVTPTCSTAPAPTAMGGTYGDGTYVLTAATYYLQGGSSCTTGSPTSETLVVKGNCEQWAQTSAPAADGGAASPTGGSSTFTTRGDAITGCNLGVETFTATATTLTFFYPCDSANLQCIAAAVYTKQ